MKKPDNDIAISVKDISKFFPANSGHKTIKQLVTSLFKKKSKNDHEGRWTLKRVDFSINKGDFFGIVGRNGSGKSTLLKMMAGVYVPTTGKIKVEGKLVPFIELGVGFNPELSGKDNVFLNGSLLGFNRREMEAMYDEIVDFAELEEHMDKKLKNFSSGMQVRLAFSIAVRARADILLIDEVLAVGDYNFQQKCYEYFRQLKKMKKTVILVSHDTNALQMFCTKGVLIEDGIIAKSGNIQTVLNEYAKQNIKDQENNYDQNTKINTNLEVNTNSVLVESIEIKDQKNKLKHTFAPKEIIKIHCKYKFTDDIINPVFGIMIQSSDGGQPIFASNTLDKKITTKTFVANDVIDACFIIENRFNDGKYFISGAVASHDRSEVFVRFINATSFNTVGWNLTAKAAYYPDYQFKLS